MSTVVTGELLANGLRVEFADTYEKVRLTQANSRLGQIMDLSVGATNRQHEFAYLESAPHMEYWRRGSSIPVNSMLSVSFTVKVYEYAMRVPWLKHDRKDDQTQSLMDMVTQVATSAALLPERFFFDLIQGTTNILPGVPTAPDGQNFFSSSARFGNASGNLLTGNGITTVAGVKADYYQAMETFRLFQDTQNQPLFGEDVLDGGVIIVHPAQLTEVFEEAFIQRRQGFAFDSGGAQVTSTGGVAAAAVSNVVQDASRDVDLWPTQRLSDTEDWYIFLKKAPKKSCFLMDREGLQTFTSLEGDNNSDHTRDTGEEYMQWETRLGAGVAVPFAAIKINP